LLVLSAKDSNNKRTFGFYADYLRISLVLRVFF
jgi:hypothetical protein